MRRFVFAVSVLLGLSLGPLAGAALALPGSLDPSFGAGGYAVVDLGEGSDRLAQTAVQPDGSVLAVCVHTVGTTLTGETRTYYLLRYSASGVLDPGFGVGGRAPISWTEVPWSTSLDDQSNWSQGRVIFTQPSTGRILLAAGQQVRAFTADGQPDVSFAAGGVLTAPTPPPGVGWYISRFEMVSDGRLVAIGQTWGTPSVDVAVLRFMPDGQLDTSFASGGVLIKDLVGHSQDYAMSVVVDHLGRILVAGTLQSDGFLLRLLADGSPDTGFGVNGLLVPGVPSSICVMVEMADGGFMCHQGGGGVIRLSPDGAVDPTYAGASAGRQSIYSIQADGTVVAAGTVDSGYPAYRDFALWRFTPLGLPDEAFANGGKAILDFGASDDTGTAIFRPDGRIVVVGSAYVDAPAGQSLLAAPLAARAAADQRGIIFQVLGGSRAGLAAKLTRSPTSSLVTLRLKRGRVSWKTLATLKCNGTPVGAVKLSLLKSVDGRKWTTVFSNVTDKTGACPTTVKFTRRGTCYFRWSFKGTSAYRSATTMRTKVVVK